MDGFRRDVDGDHAGREVTRVRSDHAAALITSGGSERAKQNDEHESIAPTLHRHAPSTSQDLGSARLLLARHITPRTAGEFGYDVQYV